MNAPQQQKATLTGEQVQQASATGVQFLNTKTTLIPGDIKQQLAVLEVFLTALANGQLVIANPDGNAVESTPDDEGTVDVSDLTGPADDGDTDQTPA